MTLSTITRPATDWLDEPIVTVPGQQSLIPLVYPQAPRAGGVYVGKASLERAQEFAASMIAAALGREQ